MSAKKIPLRMCIGCREMKPKAELVRIVKTKQGEIFIDATNKAAGRGAYVCKCGGCIEKAQKANALSHTFSMAVEREIYSRLIKECEELE